MDIQLHYVEKGSGPPLLLLHGNGENSDYFCHQIDYFQETFHVYAPDTRGHGKSPRGAAPFTLEQFALDLEDFMDEKGIGKADILGFSDGANIALLFALKNPGRVRRLILNGADLFPKGVKRSVQIPIIIGYGIVSFLALFNKKAIPKKEMLGLMVTQPSIAPEELSSLNMPVLVIAGTKDMIRLSHTQLIARSIPGSKLAILEGDHFIASRKWESFNRSVDAFFTERK
nr:alpha/beta hydrolase [uncultured Eisenbergiella sp.]